MVFETRVQNGGVTIIEDPEEYDEFARANEIAEKVREIFEYCCGNTIKERESTLFGIGIKSCNMKMPSEKR